MTENIDVAGRISLIPGEEEVLPLFEDTTGHGTSIAANETYEYSDVKGINDQVELYSAKVLDYTNSAPISIVIEGIYWAIGLAIHTGTDVFAHSTAKKDGTKITHSMDSNNNDIEDADDTEIIPDRFSAAVLLSLYAIDRLVYNVNNSSYLDIYSVYESDPNYYNNFNLIPFQ